MNVDNYFDEEVQKSVSNLLQVPILNRLGKLNNEQLGYFFSQIYYFVDAFPGYLGILLWKTNNNDVRFAIADNLVDEYGGLERITKRNFSGMHSNLLKNFIESIDTTNKGLVAKSESTQKLLDSFDDLFINSSLIEAFGSMACMENIGPPWFKLLYNQLNERKIFSKEDLFFFSLHINVDVEHGDILKKALIPLLKNADSYNLLQKGINTAASNWYKFYEGITEEMNMLFSEA